MISYVYGHRNRVELFALNMITLCEQTVKDPFEIVIVDNSDEEHWQKLKKLVKAVREKAQHISLQCVRIDPSYHPLAHRGKHLNFYNPALSQNIGARLATGNILVLSSPEVINANTNVTVISSLFKDSDPWFLLGYVDELPVEKVYRSVDKNTFSLDEIKALTKHTGSGGAKCRDDHPFKPFDPALYFLGAMKKDLFFTVGGIEERFLASTGYEDNCLDLMLDRNGRRGKFCPAFGGIHLSHPRTYQGDYNNDNKQLFEQIKASNDTLSNIGRDFGELKYIIERF